MHPSLLVNRPSTRHVYVALRPVGAGTLADAVEYSKRLKAYPLAQAGNPTANRNIDAFPKSWDSLPRSDASFFADLATVVAEEPTQAKDLAMIGLLSSLGIAKGKSFSPDKDTRAVLDQAAALGRQMLQADFTTPGKATIAFWPRSQWGTFSIPRKQAARAFPFPDNDRLLVDERAWLFFWATFPPKRLGAGTNYLTSMRDKSGRFLDGRTNYRLRVPPGAPVSQFWSVIAYGMNTKSFIAGASKVGLSSYDKATLKMNPDGSTDLWFGPKAPAGMESNWLPTGEAFMVMFRFYGPQPALFQKTRSLPDLEVPD